MHVSSGLPNASAVCASSKAGIIGNDAVEAGCDGLENEASNARRGVAAEMALSLLKLESGEKKRAYECDNVSSKSKSCICNENVGDKRKRINVLKAHKLKVNVVLGGMTLPSGRMSRNNMARPASPRQNRLWLGRRHLVASGALRNIMLIIRRLAAERRNGITYSERM